MSLGKLLTSGVCKSISDEFKCCKFFNGCFSMNAISCNYIIVLNVPFYMSRDGSVWLSELWFKDMAAHLVYIEKITYFGPKILVSESPGDGFVNVSKVRDFEKVEWIGVTGQGRLGFLLGCLAGFLDLNKAIKNSDLVHFGVAGWPIPIGWLAYLVAKLRNKKTLLIIESAFWRSGSFSFKSLVFEKLNSYMAQRVDLCVYTHEGYRKSIGNGRGVVLPASWIDGSVIRPCVNKVYDTPLRFLYVGKLNDDKGVGHLIRSIEICRSERVEASFFFLGDGVLKDEIMVLTQRNDGSVTVSNRTHIDYGPEFFDFLYGFDVLLLPTVTDEQERIIFDAFSQGLPILASDTESHIQTIPSGAGFFYRANDDMALVDGIVSIHGVLSSLQDKAVAALEVAKKYTHEEMHSMRRRLINEYLGF